MDLHSFYPTNHIIIRYTAHTQAEDGADKLYLLENHCNRYKFINLDARFRSNVFAGYESYSFNGHNPCPLANLIKFCTSVESYLSSDPQHHVVLNSGESEVGLNRAVFMLAVYFLFTGVYASSEQSIAGTIAALPSEQRSLVFLTPSQVRYVKYYERLLRTHDGVKVFSYQLSQLSMITVPLFSSSIVVKGCSPCVVVTVHDDNEFGDSKKSTSYNRKCVFRQQSTEVQQPPRGKQRQQLSSSQSGARPFLYDSKHHEYIDIPLEKAGVVMRGDINISVFHRDSSAGSNTLIKMFSVWLHSAFIDQQLLRFEKDQVDMAANDLAHRVFSQDFKVDLIVHRVENAPFLRSPKNAMVLGGGDAEGEDEEMDSTMIDHSTLESNL
jgi:hypothetical protein